MTRKMKDSGVEWIGEIPEDWSIVKLKSVLSMQMQYGANESGETFNQDEPRYIRITDIQDNNRLKEEGKLSLSMDKARAFLLDDEDLLFARSGATVGKTFLFSRELGMSAFAGYLIRAKFNSKVVPKYIYYYTLSTSYDEWKNMIFIQATIQNIGANKYSNMEISIPSKIEQEKVVDYLDKKCTKIDQTRDKEKQVIEKLKEYKQSVITEAVTKGLNPNVKLKDSGVEWIGEIPEDWQCVKLKLKVNTTKGYAFKADIFQEKGIPLVKASDIKNRTVVKSNVFIKSEFKELYSNVELSTNDILISTVGSTPEVINSAVGQIALVPKELNKSLLNQNVVKIVPNDDVYYLYLFYFLSTHSFRKYLDLIAHGTANQASLTLKDMLEYMITLPTISKQKEIADYLDKKCSSIDKLISYKEKVIKKLTEYKKSLIYECVTGKREVQ